MDQRMLDKVLARLPSAVVRNKVLSFELRYDDYERFVSVRDRLGVGQSQLLRAIVLAYLDIAQPSPSDQEVPE